MQIRGKGSETQLMRAVKTNPDAAFKLIKKKKDINATNVKGQTALIMAVENNPQLVAPLIEYGANVNIFDKDGNTPLMLAKKYAPEVEDILVAAGAKDIKPVMQSGLKMPDYEMLSTDDERRETGTTPLAVFARTQNPGEELVRRLSNTLDRRRPSHNKLRIRLNNWNNISEEDKLEVLSGPPSTNIFEILKNHLFTAITDPYIEDNSPRSRLETLLYLGVDPNEKNAAGKTALNYAILKNRHAAAFILIEHGADVNAVDLDGDTALEIAIDKNDQEAIDMLRDAGARE